MKEGSTDVLKLWKESIEVYWQKESIEVYWQKSTVNFWSSNFVSKVKVLQFCWI